MTVASARYPNLPAPAEHLARTVVEEAVRRYFVERRGRIPAFVDRTYSLWGALDVHRNAAGQDLWRAPLNAALVAPALGLKGAAYLADKAGRTTAAEWLRSREIFLETDVAREIRWRLHTELLELPYRDGARVSHADALAAAILADPRLQAVTEPLNGPWGEAQRLRMRAKLEEALAVYANNRAAAIELANIAATLGAGATLLHQVTPGVLTFGPALAEWLAQQVAVHAFPAAGLGALLQQIAPVAPSAGVSAGVTVGVLAGMAVLSAFSGVVTDPAQRALGLHQRRLVKLLDTLERNFLGDGAAEYVVRDHYVARVLDLLDLVMGVARVVR